MLRSQSVGSKMRLNVITVFVVSTVLSLVMSSAQGAKPIPTVPRTTPKSIMNRGLSSAHANTGYTGPFQRALIAMERSNLLNSDAHIDVRPLVSTTRGELSKTLTLPEEALQERRRWVEERGFSVGDVMAANACYGISGPPPPNVSVSEWRHRFPAHCRSGSKPETVAFGTVKHKRNPCPDEDPIRLRSRDNASDDPDERRWVLAAVKVSGHNWTRYDLSMHFDAIAETWRVDSISTCLSVSA